MARTTTNDDAKIIDILDWAIRAEQDKQFIADALTKETLSERQWQCIHYLQLRRADRPIPSRYVLDRLW